MQSTTERVARILADATTVASLRKHPGLRFEAVDFAEIIEGLAPHARTLGAGSVPIFRCEAQDGQTFLLASWAARVGDTVPSLSDPKAPAIVAALEYRVATPDADTVSVRRSLTAL